MGVLWGIIILLIYALISKLFGERVMENYGFGIILLMAGIYLVGNLGWLRRSLNRYDK